MLSSPLVPACLAPNTWESPAALIRREKRSRYLVVRLESKLRPELLKPASRRLGLLGNGRTMRLGTTFHVRDPGAVTRIAEGLNGMIAGLGFMCARSKIPVSTAHVLVGGEKRMVFVDT